MLSASRKSESRRVPLTPACLRMPQPPVARLAELNSIAFMKEKTHGTRDFVRQRKESSCCWAERGGAGQSSAAGESDGRTGTDGRLQWTPSVVDRPTDNNASRSFVRGFQPSLLDASSSLRHLLSAADLQREQLAYTSRSATRELANDHRQTDDTCTKRWTVQNNQTLSQCPSISVLRLSTTCTVIAASSAAVRNRNRRL